MTKIADTLDRKLQLARTFSAKYAWATAQAGAVSHPENPPILMITAMTAANHVRDALNIAKRAQCPQARRAGYLYSDPQALRNHDCEQCHQLRSMDHQLEVLVENIRDTTGTDQTALLRNAHDETLATLYRAICTANLRINSQAQEGE